MSLINDLLVNLEERRGGRGHDNGVFAGLQAADAELGRDTGVRFRPVFLIVLVVCLLAAGGYIVWQKMPSMTVNDVRANEATATSETVAENDSGKQATAETTSLSHLPEWTTLKLDDSLMHARIEQQPEKVSEEKTVIPQQAQADLHDNAQPRLQAIRLDGDDRVLNLGLGLSAAPKYRSYILESPDRLVFDMDATEFVLETDKLPTHDWIKDIRHSHKEDTLRLVFDLAHPFEIVDEQWLTDRQQLTLKLRALANTANGIAESDSEPVTVVHNDNQSQDSGENSPVVIADKHISVTESSGTRSQGVSDSYRLARRYYERREFDQAIKTIQRHLQKAPDDELAIKLYALALFQTNQTERADSVLYEATRRLPNASGLKQLYAQWLMQQDKAADALAILHESPPSMAEAPDYHALLAALQQQLGQHPESVQLYRQLVQQVPERGVWWMGLAISLEALDRREEALDAYQQALKRNLSGDLRQYVSARINALSRAQAS